MHHKSLFPGGSHAGFDLVLETPLPDLNLHLYQLHHQGSGARLVHLATEDRNNLFAATFRTPPADSTGVAHILEHTVLCGSKRYPVRDPFFAMLKRSLNTFMNALTASDWTSYPFASQNRADFDNLLGIYLDACFFPLLRQTDFLQEGHRLEFADDDPAGKLIRKGVVYNEMIGAMASPASLLGRRLGRALYQNTTYHHNSGGEPQEIPHLSWDALRAFHQSYYHPSNSWLFSYGSFPLDKRLERIDRLALQHFSAEQVDSQVPREQRLSQPQRVTETFPLAANEESQGKSMVQVAWLTCDIEQTVDRLALNLISLLLLGNPAAPLYKALLDSGLGGNLAPGGGYHDDNRSTYFAVGLQGTDPDQIDAIESLVLETLEQVARDGFTRERIDGALQRLEFGNREVSGDHYPYPLTLLMRILGPWLHADDPVSPLRLADNLRQLQGNLTDPAYLGSLIRRYLLDNQHRVTLLLQPDQEQQQREDQELQEELHQLRTAMNASQRQQVIHQSQTLRAEQETEADLSSLPSLGRRDIPATEESVPLEVNRLQHGECCLMPQPTNGINYLHLLLPADKLPAELQPLLPLFGSLLSQVGAAGQSYLKMAARIERHTGGLSANSDIHDGLNDLQSWNSLLSIKGKALQGNFPQLLDILSDLLSGIDFSQTERLAQVLGQIRTSLENSIPGSGHSYAARAAAASLGSAARQREQWSGLSLLRLMRSLSSQPANKLGPLVGELQSMAELLFQRQNLHLGITAEQGQEEVLLQQIDRFAGQIPEASERPVAERPGRQTLSRRRGFYASLPVAYCAEVFPCVAYTDPAAPALQVLAKLLRSGYLHQEIREKGGAYGGLAGYNSEAGQFSLLSYRDPHISRTLGVFQAATEWAAGGKFSDLEVDEAVLSTFSDLDRPLSPGSRGAQEFANRHQGLSLQMRQTFREQVLSMDRRKLELAAETYLVNGRADSAVAVLAGQEKLEQANRELGTEGLELEEI